MEKGVLDDAGYENIVNLLPDETPLRGVGAGGAARSNNSTPVAPTPPAPEPAAEPAAPPAYSQTGPPSLPVRGQPPAPPPSAKPVLTNARALYKYAGSDPRDLSFERDDQVAVHEYMNADWWMGQNLRTGQEGIFPRNYVQVEEKQIWPPPGPPGPPMHAGYHQQGPQAPVNPYNSHVPPMAIAQEHSGQQGEGQSGGNSKMEQHGKKFGKK